MNQYEVETLMGTWYIVAQDYSKSVDGLRWCFWIGKKIIRAFLVDDVIEIRLKETGIA